MAGRERFPAPTSLWLLCCALPEVLGHIRDNADLRIGGQERPVTESHSTRLRESMRHISKGHSLAPPAVLVHHGHTCSHSWQVWSQGLAWEGTSCTDLRSVIAEAYLADQWTLAHLHHMGPISGCRFLSGVRFQASKMPLVILPWRP